MSQQFFTSVVLANASAALQVPVGFQAGRIELLNLTAIQTPTNGEGYKAYWQTGMSSGTAIVETYDASLNGLVTAVSSAGITLLNPVGSESSAYGAVISGFTHANPGVITVGSTSAAQITAGCFIMVSAVADDQSGATLNGVYYVASVTATTITLGTAPAGVSLPAYPPYSVKSLSTSSSALYVSGGFVNVLQTAAAISPNPPYNLFSNVPSWWNEAIQGFSIGTSCFAGADNNDVILVACYDLMSP